MRNLAIVIPFALSIISSGCALQVGKDEFACPNDGKGAACSSARQIHDLTNDRSNLEGLNVTMGKIQTAPEDIKDVPPPADINGDDQFVSDSLNPIKSKVGSKPVQTASIDKGRATNEVYEPLSNLRHETMPAAELVAEPANRTFGAVEGVENEHGQLMVRRESPMALAPEPLAVIQQPKTMRVLVAAWTDSDGDLHMPGFVYVEVAPKKWLVGEQANDRPGRIVPLQIQQVTQEEERRQAHTKQGSSSLGVTERQGTK
ncbi:TraV family lipoprotein [Shewanella morhuae]|uniref:Type IV conjugative transfer system protein TraV n=1 Tax=Shewanella morhuae TaxID=365591 RepID=A0A380C004_9GAMM|nr:TraV family lipoprotein [Shewanella morhuae]SUJ10256.1 type IV conjugative transfer system protein TraV [Shewanella morhuae]